MAVEWTFPAIEGPGEPYYGPFIGGDPRDYRPDDECCTDEEIARWYRACVAIKRLESEGRLQEGLMSPGCATMGDGSTWDGTGVGIGTGLYRLAEDLATDTPEEAAK